MRWTSTYLGVTVVCAWYSHTSHPVHTPRRPRSAPPCTGVLYFRPRSSGSRHPTAAVQKLLYYDPKKRISAKRALEHSFFDDLDKTELLHN